MLTIRKSRPLTAVALLPLTTISSFSSASWNIYLNFEISLPLSSFIGKANSLLISTVFNGALTSNLSFELTPATVEVVLDVDLKKELIIVTRITIAYRGISSFGSFFFENKFFALDEKDEELKPLIDLKLFCENLLSKLSRYAVRGE